MAESGQTRGLGWLWLMVALMVFIGAFLLSVAFVFPEGIEITEKSQPTPVSDLQAPVNDEAVMVELENVVQDPSSYIGKDVVAIVRVTDILSDRALWIGSRDANFELFGVVARGIDFRASEVNVWQLIKVYGSVRLLQEGELQSQGIQIGSRTTYALSREKAYLLVRGVVPIALLPDMSTATPTATETPEEVMTEETLEAPMADETPEASLAEQTPEVPVVEQTQETPVAEATPEA